MTVRRLKRSRWAFAPLVIAMCLCSGTVGGRQDDPDRHAFPPDIWHTSYSPMREQMPRTASQRLARLEGIQAELQRQAASQLHDASPADEKAKAIEALGESPLAAVFEAIGPDARAFAQHNITLSNPFMDGRVPGSNGNRIAAEYIEFHLKKAGLKPAFASTVKGADGTEVVTLNDSFRQPFQHGTDLKITTQVVTLCPTGKEDMKLVPGKDFTVLGLSGSGEVKGQVVFCGYGIAEGPDNYRGFAPDADLSGMIALVMRFEPMNAQGKSRWAEEGWSPAASLDAKIEEVARHKPAAIMLVNPPGAADPRAKDLMTLEASRAVGSAQKIPIIMITPEAADRLISINGTLANMRERADEGGTVFKITDTRAAVNVKVSRDPIMTDNVGAVLPGRGDLADQYLIIGAHYDHVGYGPNGADPANFGKVHPGADDNASGTSGLLVLADKLATSYAALPEGAGGAARSILFLTFTAEESGLIGSRYFVNHPSIDLAKVSLMLNMDMIGRLRSKAADSAQYGLEVQGTESAEGLYDWLKPHLDSSGMDIKHGMEIAGNSDHASFYSKKMPVLFFFTGLHRQYHKPTDTFDLINQVGAAKVVGLAHTISMGLAQRKEPLTFRPRERADQPERAASPGPTPGRVRFGIAPASYSDDKPGIEVGDVYEGTSAADAGIKVGDRMIKWNGKPVTDVESWMPLLSTHKVGDEVDVTLVREGKEMVVKVKLKGRDQGDR